MYRSNLAWTTWAVLRLKRKYFLLLLRYFLSQSVRAAEVTGQQRRVLCQGSPSSGSGRGGFWSGWGCHPQAVGEAQPWAPGDSAWKDTVVLYRAQLLLTASSCMKMCLQNLWLLKHASCAMCNFHHFPPWERWDFSLRGMHVVLTLKNEYVPPSGISQPGPPPQSSQGFWFPLAGSMPWKKLLLEGLSISRANYLALFAVIESSKFICWVQ